MPKIEVKQQAFFHLSNMKPTLGELADLLPVLKSEVDGSEGEGAATLLKLEFNDTNRPDLWSTAGAARGLRVYYQGWDPQYLFFSSVGKKQADGGRKVVVEAGLKNIRPYCSAFALRGKVTDEVLVDLIQTQEKLCHNFGRKRRTFAMGVFRSPMVKFPVHYRAADPDSTKFVPLGMTESLSLREICKKHPKGLEYGYIAEAHPKFPLQQSDDGRILSFPPVINSADLGSVEVGDTELFIEITGTDLPAVTLAASIVACDLADLGFEILPVTVEYPYDTPFGREVTFPYQFQVPVDVELEYVNRLLGVNLIGDQAQRALKKAGVFSRYENGVLTVFPPPYRNDFLHPVDVIEDVMIGHGMENFEPETPSDATVGRLSAEELFGRQVRDLMIGMGFQEMIYNYLGSKKDFIDKMNISGHDVLQILNPMTENYEFVRNSVAPNLLETEAASAHAVYPHHLFEVGKIVRLDPTDNQGSVTRNSLGWLSAGADEGFNQANARVASLFYYLGVSRSDTPGESPKGVAGVRDYSVRESSDPRFIPGRAADLFVGGHKCGVFGEVNPQVLENWNIGVPATLGEVDLDSLMVR
jgi:phenylalanyl-tRNA synthetase beta chain